MLVSTLLPVIFAQCNFLMTSYIQQSEYIIVSGIFDLGSFAIMLHPAIFMSIICE